ncbi:MAG: hypothetical protein WCP99_12360 [Burkholderiales bacterium]
MSDPVNPFELIVVATDGDRVVLVRCDTPTHIESVIAYRSNVDEGRRWAVTALGDFALPCVTHVGSNLVTGLMDARGYIVSDGTIYPNATCFEVAARRTMRRRTIVKDVKGILAKINIQAKATVGA